MLDFLKRLGLFKAFFYLIFPACLVFACIASTVKGNLAYDYKGYVYFFSILYLAVGAVVWANRNTK